MINDDLKSWAMKALEKEVIKSMPATKAWLAFQAGRRALKREHAKRLRSLAAQNGARMRVLKERLAADTLALKEKREAAEAEMSERRWALLLSQR